jgi:ribose 5-phosphate isomerase B
MQTYIASDHAGFELKKLLVAFLRQRGDDVEDMGPSIYMEGDDYPDFCMPLGIKVAQNKGSFGIVIGGSGQGEAMAVNRIKGARAEVYYGGATDIVKASREHNDANVLSLGARFVSNEEAQAAVELFLETRFSNEERHIRRIKKLDA